MKNLLLSLGLALFSFTATAQVTCYGEESKDVDFWLEHFYYAKCTDYLHGIDHNGGYVFEPNQDYIGPAAWGGVDFTDIYVSKDGTYKVQMTYGIGATDELGAWTDLKVNGQLTGEQLVMYIPEPSPGTIEFYVDLYEDYPNMIQIISVKDWPVLLGIQIFPLETSGTDAVQMDEKPFTLSSENGVLSVNNLNESENSIQISTIDGRIINAI